LSANDFPLASIERLSILLLYDDSVDDTCNKP
jgi:hypothetical protein